MTDIDRDDFRTEFQAEYAAFTAGQATRVPQRRRHFRGQRYPKPAPGVVQVRVTGSSDDDTQAFVARLRSAGLRLWQTKDRLYRHEDGAVCRYYSTDLKERQS